MVVERLHPGKGSTFCDRGSNLVDGGRQTSGNRKQFRMKYRAVAREGGNSFENCAWRTGSPGIISRERNFHWWISNLEYGRKQKPPIWMKTAERAARRLFFFFWRGRILPSPMHRFRLPLPAFSPFRRVYYALCETRGEKEGRDEQRIFLAVGKAHISHADDSFISPWNLIIPLFREFPPSFLPLASFSLPRLYYSTKEKLVASDRVFDVRQFGKEKK